MQICVRVLFFLSLPACVLAHIVVQDPINTYHDVPLNVETILDFIPPMPPELKAQLDEWVTREYRLITSLVCGDDDEKLRKYMRRKHIKNKSFRNYVFLLPKNKRYFIKITGAKCREQSERLREMFNYDWYPTTYHVFGRLAHYLRYQEAIETYNLTHIHAPQTYAYHIPGKPDYLSDDNYFLVQENIGPGWYDFRHKPEWLSEQVADQLKIALDYARLQDTSQNTFINEAGHIMHVDFEIYPTGVYPYMMANKNRFVKGVAFALESVDKVLAMQLQDS